MLRTIITIFLLVPSFTYAVHPIIIDDAEYLKHFQLNGTIEFNEPNMCFSAILHFPIEITYGEEYENFKKEFGGASLIKLVGHPDFDSLITSSFHVPLMYHKEEGSYVIRHLCIPEVELPVTYIELYYGSGNQPPTIYYVPMSFLKLISN